MESKVRFGPFELDLATHELRRGGAVERLPRQPATVLALLVSRPGELVTREELARTLWGDETFVEYAQSLNFCIRQLRAALDDDADAPRYIQTLRARGYRFIAPVESIVSEQVPRAAAAARSETADSVRRRRLAFMVAAPFVVTLIAVLALRPSDRPQPPSSPPPVVAVLPFENLSGDPGQQHIVDGFVEELTTTLARVGRDRLLVIGRASAATYRGTAKRLSVIGRELGSQYLVEGSVRRAGGRVRLTAKLIDARDERHVWAESYDRDLEDSLALQSDLAHAIARQVIGMVSMNRPGPRKVDPRVYEAYLKGRHFWNRRTREGWERARALFSEAAALDPGFAPAVAGLGDCHLSLGRNERATFSEAAGIADRALAIDPLLAEAHVTRAHARMHLFDWSEAEAGFERAIALDPSYVPGRYLFAEYLVTQGRFDEAIGEASRAAALDPVSAIATHVLGVTYFFARRYDDAAREFRKALELDPAHSFSKVRLSHALAASGDVAAAEREYRGGSPRSWSDAYLAASAGRGSEARAIMESLDDGTDPYNIAIAYAALGERDRALERLEAAARAGTYNNIYIGIDPRLAPLRGNPRLAAIVSRLGLTAAGTLAGVEARSRD